MAEAAAQTAAPPRRQRDVPGQVDVDLGTAVERIDSWIDGAIRLLPNIVIALVVIAAVLRHRRAAAPADPPAGARPQPRQPGRGARRLRHVPGRRPGPAARRDDRDPEPQAGRPGRRARRQFGGDRLRLQGHPAELAGRAADPAAPAVRDRRPDRGQRLRGHRRAHRDARDDHPHLRRPARRRAQQRHLHPCACWSRPRTSSGAASTTSASATATTSTAPAR